MNYIESDYLARVLDEKQEWLRDNRAKHLQIEEDTERNVVVSSGLPGRLLPVNIP